MGVGISKGILGDLAPFYLNWSLQLEAERRLPVVSKAPTIIIGMNVSHGSRGRADIPSIATIVSSKEWSSISKYVAEVHSQSLKIKMIESLYKNVEGEDKGIFRELLVGFYEKKNKKKPEQIIIFRDGVSKSQYVVNIEFEQICQACKHLEKNWSSKITLLVAQRNHHTKFFKVNSPDNNVPPGTVVDTRICHPTYNDFYMCAHAGLLE